MGIEKLARSVNQRNRSLEPSAAMVALASGEEELATVPLPIPTCIPELYTCRVVVVIPYLQHLSESNRHIFSPSGMSIWSRPHTSTGISHQPALYQITTDENPRLDKPVIPQLV